MHAKNTININLHVQKVQREEWQVLMNILMNSSSQGFVGCGTR